MADNHYYPATGPNAGTVRLTDSTVPGSAADDVMGSMDRLYDLASDASNLTTGTLPEARLSSNVPLKNAINVWTAEQRAPLYRATPANASVQAFKIFISGETDNRFAQTGDGGMYWGSGTAAFDVYLYRSSAGVLRLSAAMTVDSHLAAGGNLSGQAVTINRTTAADLVSAYTHSGVTRFSAYVSSNGSTYNIARYDNAGAFVANVLSIDRSTGNITVPTPTTGDNSTKIATTAFVQGAISDLVASSPAALNTLNELAVALGNDPNFATTMTTLIGTKLNSSAVSAFGLTLIDDADAATARATLGADNASNITLGTLSDDRLSDKVPLLNEDDELVATVIVRKGAEAEINAIVPSEGELAYTTDTKTLRAGDGVTLGGEVIGGGQKRVTYTYTPANAEDAGHIAHSDADVVHIIAKLTGTEEYVTVALTTIDAGTYVGQRLLLILEARHEDYSDEVMGYINISIPDNGGIFDLPNNENNAFSIDWEIENEGGTAYRILRLPLWWDGANWRRDDGQSGLTELDLYRGIRSISFLGDGGNSLGIGLFGGRAYPGASSNRRYNIAIGHGARTGGTSYAAGEHAAIALGDYANSYNFGQLAQSITQDFYTEPDWGTEIAVAQGGWLPIYNSATGTSITATLSVPRYRAFAYHGVIMLRGKAQHYMKSWLVSGMVRRGSSDAANVATPTITVIGGDADFSAITPTISATSGTLSFAFTGLTSADYVVTGRLNYTDAAYAPSA